MCKKDKTCVRCEHIFTCKGKPEGVTLCLNFKERKKKDGRCEMDKDHNGHFR